jgi:hypothetical protein
MLVPVHERLNDHVIQLKDKVCSFFEKLEFYRNVKIHIF